MMHVIKMLFSKLNLALITRNRINAAEMTAAEGLSPHKVKIAVSMSSNGLGDSIVSLAWIQELYKQMPIPIEFDLYGRVKNLQFLTYKKEYIKGIYPHSLFERSIGYDIKLRIHYFVIPLQFCIPALSEKCPSLIEVLERLQDFNSLYSIYINTKPSIYGAWASVCMFNGWNRWDVLGANHAIPFNRNSRLDFVQPVDMSSILHKFSLQNRPYITIHRGIGSGGIDLEKNKDSWVKILPAKNFGAFCRLFKEKYPDILIVQIGEDPIFSLPEADMDLTGKTSLEEVAAVLRHALAHIDGESGMVHLRRALGGRSVVLFGPTPLDFFAYAENENIASPFCNGCMWLVDGANWNARCLKGFDGPKCLEAIPPEAMLAAAGKIVDPALDPMSPFFVKNIL